MSHSQSEVELRYQPGCSETVLEGQGNGYSCVDTNLASWDPFPPPLGFLLLSGSSEFIGIRYWDEETGAFPILLRLVCLFVSTGLHVLGYLGVGTSLAKALSL